MTTIESLIALLPCPFGKGTPKKSKSQYGHYIQVMQPCPRYGEEEVYRTPYFHEADELYAFWNTRTTQTNVGCESLVALFESHKRKSNVMTAWEEGANAGLSEAIVLFRQHFTDSSIQKPGMGDANPQVCKQPTGQCIQTTDDRGRMPPKRLVEVCIASIEGLADRKPDEILAQQAIGMLELLDMSLTIIEAFKNRSGYSDYAGGNPERHKAGASAPVGTSPGQLGDALNTAPPAPATESSVNKHFDDAKEYLRWLRKTASSIQDNARIVGFEDCLFTWKKSLEDMKPVSVSLEKCAIALCPWVDGDRKRQPYPAEDVWSHLMLESQTKDIERAKAVLDSVKEQAAKHGVEIAYE